MIQIPDGKKWTYIFKSFKSIFSQIVVRNIYARIQFDRQWYFLLGSHQWVKYIG